MGDRVRAEFLIEPFVEGRPGPHVRAGIEAVAPLEAEVGPFGTSVEGAVDDVADAVAALLRATFQGGGTRVQLLVGDPDRAPAGPLGDLHGALDRMISAVEQEMGAPLADLDRESKQVVVRLLSDRGAFLLRKAVEVVADRLGVSRMSVYNYLRAIEADS